MKFVHSPVLLTEVIEYLQPQPNENFIDCTVGGGGHAKQILQKTGPQGKLLGIDLDPAAIKAAVKELRDYQFRTTFINDNYKNLKQIIYDTGFDQINGILLDLGISSYQIQDQERGFSFQGSHVLDMRFGGKGKKATDVINKYREQDLNEIFRTYGEERYSRQIASEIVKQRKIKPITKTDELVAIIDQVYKKLPKPKKIHPATKVFQALRIEVNQELQNITEFLPQALQVLAPGGRLVVISFHSLEDRIVKNFFRQESKDCLCPPEIPICGCQHHASLKILTKKVVMATDNEIKINSRSRSAKLRAALKIKSK